MFHDEMHHISSFSAAEAFAYSFAGRYAERWCLFVVERTQSDVVHSPAPECDEFRYHVYYLGGIHYFVYGGLIYHDVAKIRINSLSLHRKKKQNMNSVLIGNKELLQRSTDIGKKITLFLKI